MQRSQWFRRLAALLASVPLLWLAPPLARAQDLIFDEDEEVIDSEELEFDVEDTEILDSSEFGPPVTTGLVIPGDYLDPGTAELISDLIVDELNNIPEVQPTDYYGLQDEFEIMGAELAMECAFDPICLSRVARDAGLDEVIIGRATGRSGGEIQLVLDRIEVETRSVLRYRPTRSGSDPASLRRMVAEQLPYLYDLQEEPPPLPPPPSGRSKLQTAMAWTTLGLGGASLILAMVFGISANGSESDVIDAAIIGDGVRDITQAEADGLLSDAEDDALLSNVFLGTGLALIGVSLLLFFITPGSDIDAQADAARTSPSLPTVGAGVTEDGWGIFGRVRF